MANNNNSRKAETVVRDEKRNRNSDKRQAVLKRWCGACWWHNYIIASCDLLVMSQEHSSLFRMVPPGTLPSLPSEAQ
jgi:hypothetical protein